MPGSDHGPLPWSPKGAGVERRPLGTARGRWGCAAHVRRCRSPRSGHDAGSPGRRLGPVQIVLVRAVETEPRHLAGELGLLEKADFSGRRDDQPFGDPRVACRSLQCRPAHGADHAQVRRLYTIRTWVSCPSGAGRGVAPPDAVRRATASAPRTSGGERNPRTAPVAARCKRGQPRPATQRPAICPAQTSRGCVHRHPCAANGTHGEPPQGSIMVSNVSFSNSGWNRSMICCGCAHSLRSVISPNCTPPA